MRTGCSSDRRKLPKWVTSFSHAEGLEGDPNRLRAINDMPPPKGVQRILGMVNREEKCDVTLPW